METIDARLDLIARLLDELKQDMEPSPKVHVCMVRAYNATIQALSLRNKGK